MLTDVKQQSAKRFVEVRELLDFIKDNTPKAPLPEPNNILISKGLFFVHLYGAYEFTIRSTVHKAIEIINAKSPLINECKPLFMSIVLHSELQAIADVVDKKWDKRLELFKRFEENEGVSINTVLLPTNGRNIVYKQLQSIWNCFCISYPVLPRLALGGRIKELVSNRNAIAHGTSSAIEVGALNTIKELYIRYNEMSEVCSYIIATMEDYLLKEQYLKGN